MVKVAGFPRPLYPPDANRQGKKPSADGPDVVAYKRTVSRAGRWPWQPFDDSYSNLFSHGSGPNVADSGIAGIQRQQGIEPDSGWVGEFTFNTLRSIRIPKGLPHAGEPAMDATSVNLINQAWGMFGGREPAGSSDEDQVRAAIVEFCETGLAHPGGWDYQLVRPLDVSVDPAGHVTSDCSMSAIQAFHYAKRTTGLDVPDPAQQGYSGYGNTDYYEVDHPRVTDGAYLVGDLAHYGSGGDSSHVCVCIRAGDQGTSSWWSFGSEPPSRRSLYYRSDFLFVVRPPLA